MRDLDQVIQRALRAWPKAQIPSGDQEFYLDSVALNLHSFYAGLEKLFGVIARRMENSLPSGETWHRDLLNQVAQDWGDIRPAVISMESASSLDKFRRFRHLVHNVYTMNLQPEKMRELLSDLPSLWTKLQAEFLAFADFLDEIRGKVSR